MEFGIENIKIDKTTINDSYDEYLKTSISQHIANNDVYNLTPIVSEITKFVENGRTQSLITLSDITLSNSNQWLSHSVKECDYNSDTGSIKSISVFLKDVVEDSLNNAMTPPPEIIFNAAKRCKKLRRKNLSSSLTKRKSLKCTRIVRLRIVHFKYKHPEKNIRRKLESYYDKAKKNCSIPRRIQQDLRADSVLKPVSRSRILKKVLAKANLLDETDKQIFKDQDKMLDIDPSNDTLTRINSESSQNDSINTKTAPSVVEIPITISATKLTSTVTLIQNQSKTTALSDPSNETTCINENELYSINHNREESRNETIFHTGIINVAVAQINDASILKYKTDTSSEQSREEILYKENLTSAESFNLISDTNKLTSSMEIPEKYIKMNNLTEHYDDKNCIVLNDMVNSFNQSSNDTFVVAKTSSYFRNNSDSLDISSDQTLTPSSELTNQTEPSNMFSNLNQSSRKSEEMKPTLLDTIINVGIFQTPITCSENVYSIGNSNNVIIADELGKLALPNKILEENKYSKTVIHKSFSVDNEGDRQKNVILPNEDTIKTILTEKKKIYKKSSAEEFRNFVPPVDMWDKLIVYLDMRFAKMEESLVEKIGNELKETLTKYDQYFPFPLDGHDFLGVNNTKFFNKTNESDLCKMESGRLAHLDEGMQCSLVENEVIDELKSKIKAEETTIIVEDFPLKLIKSKVKRNVNDSFEVLKSPVRTYTSVGKERGDSLLTSSSEGVRVKRMSKNRSSNRLVMCMSAPIHFFKANMLVITSVPAFFISIFLVYRFFVLLL